VHWKILAMEKDHLKQVIEIEKASFPTPWSEKMFLEELTSPLSFHFIASQRKKQQDLVLSYIIFWMLKEEVHILNLATHPGFRRLGIAQSLLLFALDFSYRRGGVFYLLEAREKNQAALQLYRKTGFISRGVRKKYYADTGEDAILMELFYGDRTYKEKDDAQVLLPKG
jgi:ribosomal-protein-alanine N-acetyltransferase